jgi:Transposase DDE domain
MQSYQPRPTRHRERHLNTLVALICGLAGGHCAQLSTIADHAPSGAADQESLIARFRRWLKHDAHPVDGWFLPVAKALLANLAHQPLVLVLDGSVVGHGCVALMLRVVYHGRALPRAWVVVQGQKGHCPQDTHGALLAQIQPLIPPPAQVTMLGDGEFDGTALQTALRQLDWQYVCRTAPNLVMTVYGTTRHIGALAPTRGELLAVRPAWMTAEAYGPVSILASWEATYAAPIYLVTNMADLDAALALYRKRAHIETFFSDQKSRGFQLHRSHLRDPQRVARLLIASCLAYLWIVYLGVCVLRDAWLKRLERQARCDLSLFRLGLRLLARCLKDTVPIPNGFLVPAVLPIKPVRQPMKQVA